MGTLAQEDGMSGQDDQHLEDRPDQHLDDRLDRATARRLARLRSAPVATDRLEAALRSQLPSEATGATESTSRPWAALRWLGSVRGAAAGVAATVVLAVALLLTTSAGPAVASASAMADLHRGVVSGLTPTVRVESIDAAARVLSAGWASPPELPDVPDEHVMACCMRSVSDRRVACVLLSDAGVPVTMTVAAAGEVRPPDSPTVVRGGVTYHVQSSGGLNMVMAERGGRWVCLIGELPAGRLIDLAGGLKF